MGQALRKEWSSWFLFLLCLLFFDADFVVYWIFGCSLLVSTIGQMQITGYRKLVDEYSDMVDGMLEDQRRRIIEGDEWKGGVN